MNQRLEELIKSFKPQFGNMKHVDILEQVGRVRRLDATVKKHQSRVKALTNAIVRKLKVVLPIWKALSLRFWKQRQKER